MLLLYNILSYFSLFLCFIIYFYVPSKISLILYLTSCLSFLKLISSYVCLFYPSFIREAIILSSLNFFFFLFLFNHVQEEIHFFILLLFSTNLSAHAFMLLIFYKTKSFLNLKKTIFKYRKVFFYSHFTVLLGLFSFLLIFINDRETIQLPSAEWKDLLLEDLEIENTSNITLTVTKDFGFIKKFEIQGLESKNVLSKLSLEENLCERKPKFCKRFNYVRFYY